uniref:Vacuolar protein sorting-associated protein 13 VPS13 adaptor binding domain-containing protein n=1 Tax=Ditylum brightwellii TaxID=49249 RepID=A0A7S1Z4M3_9STRA
MVGVYKFPLYRVGDDRLTAKGASASVIVRVALSGGTKIVSVESPLFLKNVANAPILCQITAQPSGSLLWETTLSSSSKKDRQKDRKFVVPESETICAPIPVHLVPFVNSNMISLSLVALPAGLCEKNEDDHIDSVTIPFPPSFSKNSAKRGLIRISEISLEHIKPGVHYDYKTVLTRPIFHLNVCSLRIGNFSLEPQMISNTDKSHPLIPEQRMLLFRPPMTIRNHLPQSISIQGRVKNPSFATPRIISSKGSKQNLSGEGMFTISSPKRQHRWNSLTTRDWEDIGTVQCGDAVEWNGATASDSVEIRIRLKDELGGEEHSKEFPTWSTPITVLPEGNISRLGGSEHAQNSFTEKFIITDSFGVELSLSLALEKNTNVTGDSDSSPHQNIRNYANDMAAAPRALAIFCPLWIVDSSGLDLEYKTRTPVAGQSTQERKREIEIPSPCADSGLGGEGKSHNKIFDLGLADLLKDEEFSYLQARSPFDILMIGDEKAGELSIRRRSKKIVVDGDLRHDEFSPWSNPITIRRNRDQRISVSPLSSISNFSFDQLYLALNTRTISAPEHFGGMYGTKLIHVVNRYVFVNLLDRELEVMATNGSSNLGQKPVTVGVDGQGRPFHFDDSGLIRVRPKEFGWGWSGPFSLTKKRRDLTVRLKNKLTGSIIIADLDFEKKPKSNQTIIVLRPSRHPPFRLENHTVHPLQFRQISYWNEEQFSNTRFQNERALGTILLPYHNAQYAWDEPDATPRLILVEVADFGMPSESIQDTSPNFVLGQFDLDHVPPGTKLKVTNSLFSADIMADGPTRVLRITDAALQTQQLGEIYEEQQGWNSLMEISTSSRLPHYIRIKLSAGIGVSVIDWTPQELLYMSLNDISIERSVFSGLEDMKISVSSISVDNQLWITPYPVLLKIGEHPNDITSKHSMRIRRRRPRQNAFCISWSRELDTSGTHGSLTVLRNVDFYCENLHLKVDGNLFDMLFNMLNSVIAIRQLGGVNLESKISLTRDAQLWMLLGSDHQTPSKNSGDNQQTNTLEASESTVITAAMAAKMGLNDQNQSGITLSNSKPKNSAMTRGKGKGGSEVRVADDSMVPPLSKPRHKYYIEKIRISQLGIELSWSGNLLPAAVSTLPDFMRPAMTFEGIPIMLRPFTDAHAYGTVQDHLQRVTSHYLSIRRIIDVLAGLSLKPSILIRGCLFTSREFIATFFAGISDILAKAGNHLSAWSSSNQIEPLFELEETVDGEILPHRDILNEDISERYRLQYAFSWLYPKQFHNNIVGKMGTLLQVLATLNSTISSSLRYEGGSKVSGFSRNRRKVVESVRLRPPRLFANQEGKDLLVEYVEGENVGKALLSRVRMGVYLAEGYIFHGDCALVESDLNSNPLIFLLTSERLLLLWKGGGNLNIASVVWEVTFNDIVLISGEEAGEGSKINLVQFWYLSRDNGKLERHERRFDRFDTCACHGLEIMDCQPIYFHLEDSLKILREILLTAPSTKTEHFSLQSAHGNAALSEL